MTRAYNFSPGPSALPEPVLRQAQEELLEWRGVGASIVELSHRGPEFLQVASEAESDLRTLLGVPDDYAVLFLPGGATTQQALIALNFASPGQTVDYVISGHWGRMALDQVTGVKFNIAADSAENGDTTIPARASWRLTPDAAYLHLTANETIHGIEFRPAWGEIPHDTSKAPVFLDVSSNIASGPLDISRYGLVYAGAQKNAGIAGITIVIVRRDLLGHALPQCPSVFDYANVAQNDSMFNTPPTYPLYIAGLMFKWVKAQGGVAALQAQNTAKAQALYRYLDSANLYVSKVHPGSRSRMNIPFFLRDASLDADFLRASEAAGLLALKGHKSVGGMRASLYNAMPMQGVEDLIAFLKDYEQRHG